jgi:hypothetical protein
MDANLKEMRDEMRAKLDVYHERMMARIVFQLKKIEACVEKTEAMDLEATPEEKCLNQSNRKSLKKRPQ